MPPQVRKTLVNVLLLLPAVAALLAFSGQIARALDTIAGHPMDDRYITRAEVADKLDRIYDVVCDAQVSKRRVCDDANTVRQAGSEKP